MVELLALDLRVIALSKGQRSPGLETPAGFKKRTGVEFNKEFKTRKVFEGPAAKRFARDIQRKHRGSTWMCITRWAMKQSSAVITT